MSKGLKTAVFIVLVALGIGLLFKFHHHQSLTLLLLPPNPHKAQSRSLWKLWILQSFTTRILLSMRRDVGKLCLGAVKR